MEGVSQQHVRVIYSLVCSVIKRETECRSLPKTQGVVQGRVTLHTLLLHMFCMPLYPKYKLVLPPVMAYINGYVAYRVSHRRVSPAGCSQAAHTHTSLRFLLPPRNVEEEIVAIVIWEAGCLQIRLSNYKFLFSSHEIWKWMSWVPIMASLQANLKEIKRPTTSYIATRQMNWPPLTNWNPLFVQQTSVSLS